MTWFALVTLREDGSDALPSPALEAAPAPRDPVRRRAPRGRSVTANGWARSRWAWPAAQATMLDARGAIDALCTAANARAANIAMLPSSPWAGQVGRLRCLRGVDTLTAVGLCAEIGDFERFARAEQLMSYVGLVPERRQPGTAPPRRDHEDRLGARAAAAGRSRVALPARPASAPRSPPPGQPAPEAIAIAWSAQRRLHRTWRRLEPTRQTPHPDRGRRRSRTRRVLLGDRQPQHRVASPAAIHAGGRPPHAHSPQPPKHTQHQPA